MYPPLDDSNEFGGIMVCDVCDCEAAPSFGVNLEVEKIGGFLSVIVCSSCEYELDNHDKAACKSCGLLVPMASDYWRDHETGLCFRCG